MSVTQCFINIFIHASIWQDWELYGPKSTPPQMSITFSSKCIHTMCFSGRNTVSWYVHLIPHSRPTKSGNEKHRTSFVSKIQNVSSRYVFSCVICFRGIHFIWISTAYALFLTCLLVSIYGTKTRRQLTAVKNDKVYS